MYGAILGDMIGSPYEFDHGYKSKDFEMFSSQIRYTDDSVMSLAIAKAIMKAGVDAGEDEMKKITDVFGGLCCEMEGGAIAQVSYLNKVPFVIIRAISDDVDGGGPEDFIKFEKEMSALCAKMTMEMLKEL